MQQKSAHSQFREAVNGVFSLTSLAATHNPKPQNVNALVCFSKHRPPVFKAMDFISFFLIVDSR